MITLQLTKEQFWCVYLAVKGRLDNADTPVYDAASDDFRVDEEEAKVTRATMRLLKRAEQEQAIPF